MIATMGICGRPTQTYPDGRTGTDAGYQAHNRYGEEPCDACAEAHIAKCRARWAALSPDELVIKRQGNRIATMRLRKNNPVRAHANKKRYSDANRAIIRAAKSAPCADCRQSYPYYVMQFDHLGEKNFNIGTIGPTGSRKRLLAEIAMCDVVCANCHAERSYRRKFPTRIADQQAV